jgi:alpha-tubulin suppressor-like RCC1 family protein
MPRGQGGTLSGFTPLSTPNAPTGLSVSTSIGSATVSFEPPADTGDAPITAFVVTAIDEITGESTGATGSSSPITVSPPSGGTFKFRAQAVNGFGPGRLTEFVPGQDIFSGAELYAWGRNSFVGAVGDNTIINRSSPVQIGALSNWAQIEAGSNHTASVKTDGTLWAWGANSDGRLGDGTTIARSSPVQIGALTNWAQVSAGGYHTASVKTDGTMWAWGQNNRGALGDGTTTNRSSPIQIGALTNWAQVSAGRFHTAAITTTGQLYAWGYNQTFSSAGALGDNTVVSKSSPVQIGPLTNWAQVSAGGGATVSIKTDGTLWGWGYNSSNSAGRVGDGTTINRSSPVQIGALTNWAQVSAGDNHTGAVKTNGTLWAWGNNGFGQLGQNNSGSGTLRSSPVQIGALTNWAQVSAGSNHTLATTFGGELYAWGYNGSGQLGDGTIIDKSSPVQIGALTTWAQVSAGSAHTTALLGVL